MLAVALFTFNALVPETYAALLRFADWIWQVSLSALSSRGESIPGATKLTNIARQGLSGHHYVIMELSLPPCCRGLLCQTIYVLIGLAIHEFIRRQKKA